MKHRFAHNFRSGNGSLFLRIKAAIVYLSIALLLSGISFISVALQQADSTSLNKSLTSIEPKETGLPNLQGEDAVEHLKKQGLYSSLQEAMTAARYRVYPDTLGEVDFYADNPALRMSMKFDDGAMHLLVKRSIAQSKSKQPKDKKSLALSDDKPRYRVSEASLRLIGAGYGERLLSPTGNPEMKAEANRFSYHHQLKPQITHHASPSGTSTAPRA